ncbi:sugar ABC transporter ATP-binding protein [Actinoalloteichus hymeniacidonis]|uniref:ABC-type sugar transport system, ATPase component n=1 Tax=Actinoalloteichus hymeniacidonis TaxID=340345 RepID=A0AAC9N112_9PSEU|nr:sugar ABC transporter ATP-binding protein [Actinoalloteichus hymeniacidonis]AOS66164.1 ABC-type sugar transport system, ATPase component [Actinoalloteichus hymeniacidonis]MBB5905733.1 ribose transport system ATP-binding protein [Actinoalloteichus hymeniacidonis]
MTSHDPLHHPAGPVLLEVRDITKRFTGALALDEVDLAVHAGEVHVLLGENGAGKSTLIKILGGVHSPDKGEILVDGKPTTIRSPGHARKHGIAVIHQELTLVPRLSVAENLFLGRVPRRLGIVDKRRMLRDAIPLLQRVGLDVDPRVAVDTLGIAQQQMVEIARALDEDARVLILDEPTSALTATETDRLLEIMAELRQQQVGLVFITHHLDEIQRIADRITVLRDGRGAGVLPGGSSVDLMVRTMVGRDINDQFPRHRTSTGGPLLKVSKLTRKGVFSDIDFEVRAGEVVGISGLVGAGRTEVVRAIFGADRYDSGTVEVAGTVLPGGNIGAAMRAGIGLVPEDRKGQGLVLNSSVGENMGLVTLRSATSAGLVDRSGQARRAAEMAGKLRVKHSGANQTIRELSGGNQQKVAIGKWLLSDPKVLMLDEPTRGIDVGAKVEIYELINALTDSGHAVLLVSSELPEVIGMSDRILVMAHGRITGELPTDGVTQEQVMALAVAAREEEDLAS